MNNRRTAASARRSYMGARSRAEGAGFEAIITSACDYYRAIGRADIEKTPEPMKPLGGADRSGRFLACYTKQAQPDYKGVLSGGRAVVFEAKHTDTGRLLYERVSAEQAACLRRISRLGGIAFVLCSFNGREFYRIPWPIWEDMKKRVWPEVHHPGGFGRVPYPRCAPGVLLFLEGVKEKKDGSKMDT